MTHDRTADIQARRNAQKRADELLKEYQALVVHSSAEAHQRVMAINDEYLALEPLLKWSPMGLDEIDYLLTENARLQRERDEAANALDWLCGDAYWHGTVSDLPPALFKQLADERREGVVVVYAALAGEKEQGVGDE